MNPKNPQFPGMRAPTTDFQSVRDGMRGLPLYREVDLSTARSIAAGTALEINVTGNSFYADPLVDAAGLPIGGVAIVHFQDTNLNPAGTPFTIAPQAIMNIPFTRLLVENPAQVGKRMRFIFGVDLDFSPGINAQVSITGTVSVAEQGFTYGASYKQTTGLAANTPETVFAPGANVNGAIIWEACFQTNSNPTPNTAVFIAKSGAAPTTILDGDVIVQQNNDTIAGGGVQNNFGRIGRPTRIAAGKGFYYISNGAELFSPRMALYTLL